MTIKLRSQMFDTSFVILGHPRSGTNYLSNIVRAHPLVSVQIEPLSMHDRRTLRDDLAGPLSSSIQPMLECRCGTCRTCSLFQWLQSEPYVGFKETLLFDLLPTVAARLPNIRVIYISRHPEEIAKSYIRNDLYRRWRMNDRVVVRKWLSEFGFEGEQENLPDNLLKELVVYLTDIRNHHWEKGKNLFQYQCVDYDDLIADPIAQLTRIMRFIGLDVHGRQVAAIAARMKIGTPVNTRHPYATHKPAQVA